MKSDKPDIDIELLRRYYNNELSDSQRNALEKRAMEDPFLMEAMEGFDDNPDSFNTFYTKHQSKLKKGRSYTLVIGVAVLALLFGLTTFLNRNTEETENLIAENNIVEEEVPVDSILEEEYEVIPMEIETLDVIDESEIISVEEVVEHQEHIPKTEPNQEPDHPIEMEDEINLENDFNIEDEEWHREGQEVVETIYMFDLMVIDYREIARENKNISYKRYELSGTSADMENEDDIQSDLIETEVQIPYVNYLRKSMSFFAKSDFKKALNRYLIILDQYPDDLNALFYGGLAYYNLGEYEKSANFFDQIVKNKIGTFNEEAMWYHAKSLIQLGKKQEASSLLEEIIILGGFYTKDAIELKRKL